MMKYEELKRDAMNYGVQAIHELATEGPAKAAVTYQKIADVLSEIEKLYGDCRGREDYEPVILAVESANEAFETYYEGRIIKFS